MRALSIKIHNFRSFKDIEITLTPYTLLVGANNSGKSNLIDAIRVFYEKDLKYDEARDFPKFTTSDKEVWIEIEFQPSIDEIAFLKEDYKLTNETFKVRKYIQSSEIDDEGKSKNGIYAYVGGELSNHRFYGAKNVQQGKFGEIIYIPAVSKLDEHTKLTGPSSLRDLINIVLKNLMGSSTSYNDLRAAFETFETKVKSETTIEGYSLSGIESEITDEISDWGTSFELMVNSVTTDEIVKSLIGHRLQDKILGQPLDPKCYGQGFQRHLIFTLIKLSARYSTATNKISNKKDFSPQMTWILFEEPEAFLHPSQIDILDLNLRSISNIDGTQVLISTHNPEFVSLNIEDLTSLVRISRDNAFSTISQITESTLKSLFLENQRDSANWISSNIFIHPDDLAVDMETIKYALWLDPRRCCAFFSNKVLLVEGPTEIALLGYLLFNNKLSKPAKGIFILDTLGKFNIHRFMNLLSELKINHAVLYDFDNGKHTEIEKTIQAAKSQYTIGIDTFPFDLEKFLGIPPAGSPHRKPQHVMWHLNQGKISQSNINSLINKVSLLLQI